MFLDQDSNEKLLNLSTLPEHIVNYNFLLSQKSFMEIIKNGGTVKLHSTEWVNKSSGRGTTKLLVTTKDGQESYSFPYWFPFTHYEEVFPRLFPWANFSADEKFYKESDEELWKELNCYYDRELNQTIVVGDSFEEFRKKLKPMRFINHSNEVAEYMLILSLNSLGKSFLEVDDFVEKNQPYAVARPKEVKNDKD